VWLNVVLLQVAVMHVPFLNIAFGTAPLSLVQWLLCAAMASAVLIYSELQSGWSACSELASRHCNWRQAHA